MPLRFATARTPIGTALAVSSAAGLVALRFVDGPPEHELQQVRAVWKTETTRDDEALEPVIRQLDEYFGGERRGFDITVDWGSLRGFPRAALEAVCDIPYGETAGYGEVAIRAGSPGAARAVGSACARTPLSVVIPVHRVVRADGTPGEYGARPGDKRFLLDLEVHALTLDRTAGVTA